MPSETLAVAKSAPAVEVRYRYRLRFAKAGDLRLVSHHDLMHVFERMMRRAEIPFAVTQGFHPQPKMSFALSLALGVIGRNEVFDVELTHDVDADELMARLNRVAPAGLTFSFVARLDKKPSSQVRRMFYRLVFPNPCEDSAAGLRSRAATASCEGLAAGLLETTEIEIPAVGRGCAPSEAEPFKDSSDDHFGAAADGAQPRPTAGSASPTKDDIAARIATFLASSEYWIHRTRPQPRRLNIRPFVDSLTHDSTSLSLILWVTQIGAARPEEIVGALGLSRLFDDGAVLERTHLELLGEQPEHERFVPDLSACSTTVGATSAPAPETTNDTPSEEPSRAAHTALMDNPMSFDS